MLSTTRRRALAALAATALAAGLVAVGAAPAQALPGGTVILAGNLTATFVPSGAGREIDISADLDVLVPAVPGTVEFTVETLSCDPAPLPTSQVMITDVNHDGIYVVPAFVPATGAVRVYAAVSDGAGGETTSGPFPFWTVSEIPGSVSTTITPSTTTAGTGILTFDVGPQLTVYSLDLYIDGVYVSSTDVGWCSTQDFGYSGFAVGQTLEVRNGLTGATPLASFVIPDLPTQAIDPAADPAAAADPTLAATGVDALPYLAISALLLAAGAAGVLMARHRRFAD